MAATLQQLERVFPYINWREPLPGKLLSEENTQPARLVCRICLAQHGLKGADLVNWPVKVEEFKEHLRNAHGI